MDKSFPFSFVLTCSSNRSSPDLPPYSYVNRDKAFEDGLAFWTSDGIPGIQVGSLPYSA